MIEQTDSTNCQCHLCDQGPLELMPQLKVRGLVSSDCKPTQHRARLAMCPACATIQKLRSSQYELEIADIYKNYSIYTLADGADQKVFVDQCVASRSSLLLGHIQENAGIDSTGAALDIGCGNGAFLSTLSRALPAWKLFGLEVTTQFTSALKQIPRFEHVYIGDVSQIDRQFDLVVMIHALEHIVAPTEYLAKVHSLLVPGGVLFVEAPNWQDNPYDLLIFDHCTHFAIEQLSDTIKRAGFEIVSASTSVIPRELSVIAQPLDAKPVIAGFHQQNNYQRTLLVQQIDAIHQVRHLALKTKKRKKNIGIFGTGISSTWLWGELEGEVSCFVDEDSNKQGKLYFAKPVLAPVEVPSNYTIFVPFPPAMARSICTRLQSDQVAYIGPQGALPKLPK